MGETSEIQFELGAIDPLSGRSLVQTAAESRSLHRSQDMGRTQPLGSRSGGLAWLAGGGGEEATDPFAGVDTRLAAIAATESDAELRSELETSLERVEGLARGTRRTLSPVGLELAVAPLAEIVGLLAGARARLTDGGSPVVADLIDEKLRVAELALAAAAGVAIEATADRETAAPGRADSGICSMSSRFPASHWS